MEIENFVLNYLDDTLPVQALADGTFHSHRFSGEEVYFVRAFDQPGTSGDSWRRVQNIFRPEPLMASLI